MYFEAVSQSKPNIALYDVSEYRQYHVRLQLVTASQTIANLLILDILSTTDFQNQQISIWHFIYYVISKCSNAFLELSGGVLLFTRRIKLDKQTSPVRMKFWKRF
jgi:hypothetical protein